MNKFFRLFAPVMIMALALTFVLAACGEEAPASIPSYNGATSLTVPDSLKSSMGTSLKEVKNVKIEAYKTADESAKVKTFFSDNLGKSGWANKTTDITSQAGVQDFENLGGFVLGYEKGSQAVAVLGMPSIAASALGINGVGEKDTLYLVLSGSK